MSVADPEFSWGGANSQSECSNLLLQSTNEVCEGNVFTGVCLSTRGGWALCLCPGGSPSRGVSIVGSLSRGSLAVRTLLECILVLQIFCRKLHENERIWTRGWRASLAPSLDPPMRSVPPSGISDRHLYLLSLPVDLICSPGHRKSIASPTDERSLTWPVTLWAPTEITLSCLAG